MKKLLYNEGVINLRMKMLEKAIKKQKINGEPLCKAMRMLL